MTRMVLKSGIKVIIISSLIPKHGDTHEHTIRCVSKNVPPLTCYNLGIHNPITVNFWQKCYSENRKSDDALFSHLTHLVLVWLCRAVIIIIRIQYLCISRMHLFILLWPPYVIGGPLYFCPVISIYLSIFYLLLFFLA